MSTFFSGIGVILLLELRQRVRSISWYILLAVFVGLILMVTVLLSIAFVGFGGDGGGGIYSTIIYFVLLLGTLVAPALSGNAINGDRDAGTLATTQVTLITTWQLILGKFLAAWVTALAFLAAAVPFLIYATIVGSLGLGTILISILVLAVELGIVAAVGVGLSGLMSRPLFSIVASYLIVAGLSIGTVIVFGLGGLAVQTTVTTTSSYGQEYNANGVATSCTPPATSEYPAPRFDLFWGALVANPYVILADAVPTIYDQYDQPTDLFGFIKLSVRSAQQAPETVIVYDECALGSDLYEDRTTARETIESTTPGWAVGLFIQLLLAGGLLVGAHARTTTPAAKLSRGSRIA